jgi:GIY-YIG catalytic domain
MSSTQQHIAERQRDNLACFECRFSEIDRQFVVNTRELEECAPPIGGFRERYIKKALYRGAPNNWMKQWSCLTKVNRSENVPITRLQAETWLGLAPYTLQIVEKMYSYINAEFDRWFMKAHLDKQLHGFFRAKGIPRCLSRVPKIRKGTFGRSGRIYFLVKDEKVVYVGQTIDPWPNRIYQHTKGSEKKEFDSFYYIDVKPLLLDKYEREYIRLYNPKYNIAHRNFGEPPPRNKRRSKKPLHPLKESLEK